MIVRLVNSKHHDQVLYDPWALAYCHRHVQRVRIVLGTEIEGRSNGFDDVFHLLFQSMNVGNRLLQTCTGISSVDSFFLSFLLFLAFRLRM